MLLLFDPHHCFEETTLTNTIRCTSWDSWLCQIGSKLLTTEEESVYIVGPIPNSPNLPQLDNVILADSTSANVYITTFPNTIAMFECSGDRNALLETMLRVDELDKILSNVELSCSFLDLFFPTHSYIDIVSTFLELEFCSEILISVSPTFDFLTRVCIYGPPELTAIAQAELLHRFKKNIIGRRCLDPLSLAFVNIVRHGHCLAIAESCTGGALSALMTTIPGISDLFKGGVCTYSIDSKQKLLGIDPTFVQLYGQVSSEVSLRMAESIRSILDTTVSIGITCFAGPTATSLPVGTVFIALSCLSRHKVEKFVFKGTREEVMRQACWGALMLLSQVIEEHCIVHSGG
ncbi:hypothetical protein P9112_000012 [Eukaryota sp. TZLM1-RC]